VLGSLLDYLLGRVGSSLDLLVGTSGDTGPAAIAAVRNRPNLDIVVLYPSGGRITQVQGRHTPRQVLPRLADRPLQPIS